jgi:hypothetical protein
MQQEKLCVFCGENESKGPMTREHFVPKCLWSRLPSGIVTVPAHLICNQAYSDDNDYFRLVLANDYGAHKNNQAQEVVNGPVRRMFMWRRGQFRRHTKNFGLKPQYSEKGIYLGDEFSFTIDAERMNRVVRNIVKGIYYVYQGNPMNPTTLISANRVAGEDDPLVIYKDNMLPWQDFGDDVFQYRFGLYDEEKIVVLMRFYGYRCYFSMSVPPEEVAKLGQ